MRTLLFLPLTLVLIFSLEGCTIRFVSEKPPLGDYIPPKLIEYVEVNYPEEVKAQKIEGTVVATLHITDKGYVRQVEIERSPDPTLSHLFYVSAKEWKYLPALRKGRPVNSTKTISYPFQIPQIRTYSRIKK